LSFSSAAFLYFSFVLSSILISKINFILFFNERLDFLFTVS
jgi:hypothetical protein